MSNNDWYKKGARAPVGIPVWVRWRDGREWKDWKEGVFKAGYDSQIWFRYGVVDHVKPSHDAEFKPLKSKQDQEREKFVGDITGVLASVSDMTFKYQVETLFDAGYRKVKPLSKEVLHKKYQTRTISELFEWLLENNHIVSEGE